MPVTVNEFKLNPLDGSITTEYSDGSVVNGSLLPASTLTADDTAKLKALVESMAVELAFQSVDYYAIGASSADYTLDLTNTLALPAGVTATAPSLSARGAYVSNANQCISIALATVLPALTASAFTVEVEIELDASYTTDSNRTAFEFGGTTNNRHNVRLVNAGGTITVDYNNVSTTPGLSVKTSSNPLTGLPRALRILSACSGTGARIYGGSTLLFAPTDLQAVGGALSLNLGMTKSTGGDFLFGWIRKVRIWQSVVSLDRQRAGTPVYLNDATCWGDSLTQGAGASPTTNNYPVLLAKKLGRNVYNRGIAGETSTQIRDRFIAEQDRIKHAITIIWAGRNNSVAATVLADVDAMVSRLPNRKFLVLGIINRGDGTENAGTSAYNNIVACNAALAAAYPANYLPLREHLVSVSGGANDAPSPSSMVDGLHLNSTYYGVVADYVAAAITARGW